MFLSMQKYAFWYFMSSLKVTKLKLTIAGNIRGIKREHGFVLSIILNMVSTIHKTKVGTTMKHIKVHAAIVVENVCENFRESWNIGNKLLLCSFHFYSCFVSSMSSYALPILEVWKKNYVTPHRQIKSIFYVIIRIT